MYHHSNIQTRHIASFFLEERNVFCDLLRNSFLQLFKISILQSISTILLLPAVDLLTNSFKYSLSSPHLTFGDRFEQLMGFLSLLSTVHGLSYSFVHSSFPHHSYLVRFQKLPFTFSAEIRHQMSKDFHLVDIRQINKLFTDERRRDK